MSALDDLPPLERIRIMATQLVDDRSWSVERALRDWARSDAQVAATIAQSEQHVFGLVQQALEQLGHDARQRADAGRAADLRRHRLRPRPAVPAEADGRRHRRPRRLPGQRHRGTPQVASLHSRRSELLVEILHSAIAILGAIVLIIRFKVDPVVSLLLACIYLGLATGLGAEGTVAQITGGFGEIMAEVGLLIGFGVLIGALLHSMGTFSDLVEILARRVGRRLPYAMAATLSTIFPSIYVDVQVVLAAPMAKESAPAVDRRHGLPWLAGAMAIGIFAGYVFVIPGLAAVAIAGLMDVPLGTYLLYGLPIGLTTALITTFLFRLLLGRGLWNDETDYRPATRSSRKATSTTRPRTCRSPRAPRGCRLVGAVCCRSWCRWC